MFRSVSDMTAEILRVLGHPLRLKIIECLRGGERCVCEIIPAVGAEQSVVSKHLALLRQAGLLSCRKEGLRVIYWVRDPKAFEICDLAREIILQGLGELAELLNDSFKT
ncbi:MAG: metalloregulator ArsR/SmtB family transcription factor [Bacillota bacterium]